MVINHVGEVVISLGGEEWEKNLCITLLAISNTIGRISVGYLADRWYRDISPSQHSHSLTHSLSLFLVNSVLHLNREWWLVGSLLLMASGHSMLFLVPYFWYTPIMTIATGLSYGGTCYPLLALLSFFWHTLKKGLFAMVPLIVSFYFGLPHFGLNYGITATAPALGSLAFGMIFLCLLPLLISLCSPRLNGRTHLWPTGRPFPFSF